jgi:acetyl esterase/lipase
MELTYKEVGDRKLKLFVYKPNEWKSVDKRPAFVYIHGGGWVGGNASGGVFWAQILRERGMLVLGVQYRFAEKGKRIDPGCCIEDAKSAMRYIRGHAAELGLDPNRIAAMGSSAGGHLAASCALLSTFDSPADDLKVSCKPNALILLQPVLDNGPQGYGRGSAVIQAQYKAYSPAHNIVPGVPPCIIFAGDKDASASLSLIQKFTVGMKAAGNLCDLHVYPGIHGFVNEPPAREDIYKKSVEFLEKLSWLPVKMN